MLRKRKTYSRPKRPFDKVRIDEEAKIKEEYGLKNKKEIWKAEAKIKSMREKAKKLISAGPDEQQALFERLGKIGIKVNSITDILGLDRRDYLEQRLQTIVVKKMMARSIKGARQLITHKKVLVDGKMISAPSYIVPFSLRDKISLKQARKKKEIAEALASGDNGTNNEKTDDKVEPVVSKDQSVNGESNPEPKGEANIGTAPAEDQVENAEENKETKKEIMEDSKENA